MRIPVLALPLACILLPAAPPTPADYKISGPHSHENLSIFLIHSSSPAKRPYMTLKAAMEQKKVIVYETQDVNELAVENVSDQDVYIQGGDIVKGGQQDRLLGNDYILSAKSGKVAVSAFCVEHGRWSQRGKESANAFGGSANAVGSNSMKIAARKMKDQSAVWKEVEKTQARLSVNAGVGAVAADSPSSLQLSLESKAVADSVRGYVKALSGVLSGKPDVVGFAFAVNGVVNSADVYSSPALFGAMWPKLLEASAVEAVRQLEKGKSFPAPAATEVESLLSKAAAGKETTADVGKRVKLVTRETDKELLFESLDGTAWVHRSYVKK